MKLDLATLTQKNKEKLEEEKKRVQHEIKIINESQKDENESNKLQESEFESIVEDAVISESNKSQKNSLNSYLTQINAALQKIQNHTYGVCERCGKTIPLERLEADPSAIYCLSCAEIVEQGDEEI